MEKAVVLLSGGIDSTTCLAMAVKRFGKEQVTALSIYYGQKHQKELESAKKVAAYYGVGHIFHDITSVMAFSTCSLLQQSEQEIPHLSYQDQLANREGEKPVSTYVPFRNGLFLSVAAAIAVSIEASVIYYGAHADDAAGAAYPDCTPAFYEAMNRAIEEGSGHTCRIEAPLLLWNKERIVAEGLRLKAPYAHTWSCYEGKEVPCGVCGTCRDRAAAFAANHVPDPALEKEKV